MHINFALYDLHVNVGELQTCTHPNHFTIKGAASIHRQAPSSFLISTPYLLERAYSLYVEDEVDAERQMDKEGLWSNCSLHVIFTIGWDEFYSVSIRGGRSFFKIHFFSESGLKMIQFKTKSKIFIQLSKENSIELFIQKNLRKIIQN